ncbi:MAG: hypothetical protein P0S95_02835 [Rhabdochlamydiaceae bacterium]|nr:hypothetical protein [Candidatus Amphrikana amoebophyrae]
MRESVMDAVSSTVLSSESYPDSGEVFEEVSHLLGDAVCAAFSGIASLFTAPVKPKLVVKDEIPSIFSRMSAKQQAKLNGLMRSKSDVGLEAKCDEILTGDYRKEIFSEPNWLVYMFKGYKKGLVTGSQLAAASHLDLFMRSYPDRLDLIQKIDKEVILANVKGDVAGICFDSLSDLEQLVFYAPIDKENHGRKSDYDFYKLSKETPFIERRAGQYMVLSPAVVQLILNKISPKHAVTIFPTFGYSKKMDHFLRAPNLRVMAVDCYYFPQPKILHDRMSSSPFSYSFHDLAFHAYMTSFDPYREFEDSLATHLWETDKKAFLKPTIDLSDRSFQYLPLSESRGNDLFSLTTTNEERFWLFIMITVAKSKDPARLSKEIKRWYKKQSSSKLPSLEAFKKLHVKVFNAIEDKKAIRRLDRIKKGGYHLFDHLSS